MQVLYRNTANGINLNSTKFSGILGAGFCLAMTISWAKAALGTPGAASSYKPLMRDFAFWGVTQSNYEINKSAEPDAALRAVKTIEAKGLKLIGARPGQIELKGAFWKFVDEVLVDADGTFLLYICGEPPKTPDEESEGAHFLGWRRRVGSLSGAEFFDPNYGCLAAEPNESADSVKRTVYNHLDFFFAGKNGNKNLTDLCCYFPVELG
jgi:hypothetical protein